MPSDETRRVLRTFGVAVTTYEDAVEEGRAWPTRSTKLRPSSAPLSVR